MGVLGGMVDGAGESGASVDAVLEDAEPSPPVVKGAAGLNRVNSVSYSLDHRQHSHLTDTLGLLALYTPWMTGFATDLLLPTVSSTVSVGRSL